MPPVAMQTAQDLLRFREPGKTAELVRGVLIVREPPATGHGARAARLTVRVGAFVRLVWVLDQKRGDARIYRADGTISTVEPDGELNGEDVLPGFRCPLRDIL